MSDQTTDNNPITDLATVEAQIGSLATIDIDAIGGQLGTIYAEAEARGDIETVNRAGWLWDMAQQQHAALTTSHNAAATAMTIAKAVTAQRDAAISEHAELLNAADNWHLDHPVVNKLVEEVEESTFEAVVNGFVVCTNEPGEDIVSNFFDEVCDPARFDEDTEIVGDFIHMLFGVYSSDFSDELKRKVYDFILEIHPLIKPNNYR
jgi:hypothetical protein